MKKLILTISIILIWGQFKSFGQYQIRIENEKFVNSTTYDFDIYFYSTTGAWEFATTNIAILYNTSWPAGTMTGAMVSGSSQLSNSSQIPNSSVNLTSTAGTIRIAGRTPPGAGNGSIISTSGIRFITVRLTSTSGFNSVSPDLKWKFNASPFQSVFAYVGTTNTSVISGSGAGVANQVNCFNPIYWTGTSWSGTSYTGVTTGSSTSITAPTSDLDATVLENFSATNNISVRALNLRSGKTFSMNTFTLNLGHTLNRNGVSMDLSNATLNLTGSTDATKNQSISTGDISLVNLGFSGSGSKTLNDIVSVTGTVTGAGSAILNANGKLIIKSTLTQTARIAELPSTSTISGNITVERFMPANRRFRLISSPVVGATANHWRNNGSNTPGIGTHITGPGGASNGFDISNSNNPSAFSYNESLGNASATIDPGWIPFSTASQTLNSGEGYRLLVRGDRTINPLINDPTRNTTTLSVTGTNPPSSITKSLSYTGTNGWNLLGNPYPSAISWAALTKTGSMSGTYYTYNTASNAYVSWNGTTGSAGDIIHSSQAFFVRANGTDASITFEESDKVSGTGGFFGKKELSNHLEIILNFDSANYDQAYLHFREDAQNFEDQFDATKLINPNVNLGLNNGISSEKGFSILSMNDSNITNATIGLNCSQSTNATQYSFRFQGIKSFTNHRLFLNDRKNGTQIEIEENMSYPISLNSENEKIYSRFYLSFLSKINALNESDQIETVSLFPNPVESSCNFIFPKSITTENKTVEIFNNQGQLISTYKIDAGVSTHQIQMDNYIKGIYVIRFTVEGKYQLQYKIVKL